jgi:hypothetical protein
LGSEQGRLKVANFEEMNLKSTLRARVVDKEWTKDAKDVGILGWCRSEEDVEGWN